eukprot:SAG31_NODE_165_length_21701_cov_9.786409_9_plen_63_part_00
MRYVLPSMSPDVMSHEQSVSSRNIQLYRYLIGTAVLLTYPSCDIMEENFFIYGRIALYYGTK